MSHMPAAAGAASPERCIGRSIAFASGVALCLLSLLVGTPRVVLAGDSAVTVWVDDSCADNAVVRTAAESLASAVERMGGCRVLVSYGGKEVRGQRVLRLKVDRSALSAASRGSEDFRLMVSGADGVAIAGSGPEGVLWGVRDFVHFYAADWLEGLRGKKPLNLDVSASPPIATRGLWTWQHSCYDPYAYLDWASEWKLNTACFWNRGVPMDAARLNAYAHRRGVRISWGFGWAWSYQDLADASPPLSKRLLALYEKQKARIGPQLGGLCPNDPETPGAIVEYVLDVFEKQYAWIPDLDGIYFQCAGTESLCPCSLCQATPRGESVLKLVLPALEQLHRHYPDLRISWGVHNTGDTESYKALKAVPSYCNILWEDWVPWARTMEIAKDQMTYRGADEDYGGLIRMTMNGGMVFRGLMGREWLGRVEQVWDYLEEGKPDGLGKGYRAIEVDGRVVGYPCTSDWRPPSGGRLIDNPNFQELMVWSRMLAEGPPKHKGEYLLVEAGLVDLKPRRVPAMAAEVIWNPLVDPDELERRCGMIWQKQTGAWREPAIPYWQAPSPGPSTEGLPSMSSELRYASKG